MIKPVNFRGKPITKERLGWWISIILSKVFGGYVRLENSDRKIKIFPLLWGGEIHLLGAQYEALSARFGWPYTLSLRVPDEVAVFGKPSPQFSGRGKVCVILCHLSSPRTDLIVDFFKAMTPDSLIVLGYGGKLEDFESIRHPDKFFIRDSRIRGVGYRQSYFGLLDDLSSWLVAHQIEPRWITILDYDCLPLDQEWNNSLVATMESNQAGFGGKLIRNCTGDNSLFVCNALRDGILQRIEKQYPELHLYRCLGAIFCLSADAFNAVRLLRKDFEEIFFEVSIPTCACLKGLRIVSLDAISDLTREVRFRPEHEPEAIEEAIRSGIRLVHPVKQIETAIDIVQKAIKNI